jgi:CDP-diacylglycerol--glycerol-3-phosphate 3-phosphatidyltransferase
MGVYSLKPAFQRTLEPVIRRLVDHDVSPDLVTAVGVCCAAAAGAAIAAGTVAPWSLFLVPGAVVARLAANAVDGQVARAVGGDRPTGMLWNEMGDRLGDVAILAAFGAVPGVPSSLVSATLVAMLLSSSLGVLGAATGGARTYVGIMAKPDRMVVVATAAPLAFWLGSPVLHAALWIVLIGVAITFGQRWRAIATGGPDA